MKIRLSFTHEQKYIVKNKNTRKNELFLLFYLADLADFLI